MTACSSESRPDTESEETTVFRHRRYHRIPNTPTAEPRTTGPSGRPTGQCRDASHEDVHCRNYLGAYSRWTRQTVLTEEGYLVVRDVYEPGRDVDGYVVGPCWLLRPDCGWREDDQPDRGPTNHNPRQNWFDAPAWDHAWWQTQKKRILVWIHPGQGKTFGVTGHDTSADISRKMGFEYYPTQNSHAKAIAKADTPEVFLSVLAPFNEGLPATEVAARIKTCVDNAANCTATVDRIAITVSANGTWQVER